MDDVKVSIVWRAPYREDCPICGAQLRLKPDGTRVCPQEDHYYRWYPRDPDANVVSCGDTVRIRI